MCSCLSPRNVDLSLSLCVSLSAFPTLACHLMSVDSFKAAVSSGWWSFNSHRRTMLLFSCFSELLTNFSWDSEKTNFLRNVGRNSHMEILTLTINSLYPVLLSFHPLLYLELLSRNTNVMKFPLC